MLREIHHRLKIQGIMRNGGAHVLLCVGTLLVCCACSYSLDPTLDASQYGHNAWTAKEGFSVGAIFAMAQTPDGYLWLGSEFGLFRFDGIHAVPWSPPTGQRLPEKPYALLVSRDGTLWIGTFAGLVSWKGGKISEYPEIGDQFVTSLLEDQEGTVWAGILGHTAGQLCAIRGGHAQCYSQDGAFGAFVWSLFEDRSGTLWAGADSGLWRWRPSAPKRYALPGRVGDLVSSDDGQVQIGISGAGLKRLISDKLQAFAIRAATNQNALVPDGAVDSNKLLRDRDGGLWIGTHQRGLIHIHNGKTDVFTKSDGLSGDISCSLFEDREGNVWYASSRGLDRFRELPVTTISMKQGLSSELPSSLVASKDGSIWIGTRDGLTRWKNGQATVYRKANGLPADFVNSLHEDNRGRVWATFPGHKLAYFRDGRFVTVSGLPSEEVYSIASDAKDNLWLSGNKGLSHIREGRVVENFPWSSMGRQQQAKVVISDQGGVWLAFWVGGGVLFFKDGQSRASYTAADGLGKGNVGGIQLDQDGALWAATQEGGLSRVKDGHIATLTTKNGLPCDPIHWSVEDNDRSLWLNTACGLVRIARSELDAWIADPKRRIETTLWDASDGVGVTAVSPAYFNPPVTKSTDGKLWFLGTEGVAVVDPHHVVFNPTAPPVRIEKITVDDKSYAVSDRIRLPARARSVAINYTALSLVVPEKVRFRYKLEGQDQDWHEVINSRQVQYTNLTPRNYRFRVIACNNSGVWNEAGASLDFVIPPAWYQTNWFRVALLVAFLGMTWGIHELRVRQMATQFNMRVEERVSERSRIARDLHDTLLQSFQGLVFRFQAARYQLPHHPEQASDALDSALISADQAIAEGRGAIQELRSGASKESNLEQMLLATGRELASSQNAGDNAPALRVIIEGQQRAKRPMIREEIYRIARELLRNAYRHAQARSIEAELRYDTNAFLLIIRDDGKGIDPKVVRERGRAGHWGLPGMYERAEGIGARVDIWSEAGAGTEVRLTVPAAIAYEKPADRGRFKLFRKTRIYERRS